MLKAYNTYPGDSPAECGCLLVFAESRGKAKVMGCKEFWGDVEFTGMSAIRLPEFDDIANLRGNPWVVEDNNDLPEGRVFYVSDSGCYYDDAM